MARVQAVARAGQLAPARVAYRPLELQLWLLRAGEFPRRDPVVRGARLRRAATLVAVQVVSATVQAQAWRPGASHRRMRRRDRAAHAAVRFLAVWLKERRPRPGTVVSARALAR